MTVKAFVLSSYHVSPHIVYDAYDVYNAYDDPSVSVTVGNGTRRPAHRAQYDTSPSEVGQAIPTHALRCHLDV